MPCYQIGPELKLGDKRCKAVAKELQLYASSPFYKKFLEKHSKRFHLDKTDAPLKAHRRGIKAASHQDQDQDRDQEDNPLTPLGDSEPKTTPAGTPSDFSPMEYAKVFLGDVGLPFPGNWKVAVGAIEAIAAANKTSHAEAFEYLRSEALDAVARGDSVDHLWLLNGRYWPTNRGNKSSPSDAWMVGKG